MNRKKDLCKLHESTLKFEQIRNTSMLVSSNGNFLRMLHIYKLLNYTYKLHRQNTLKLIVLWANSADVRLMFFLVFLKIGFSISCKLSPKETICMSCVILFLGKVRKKYSKISSAENFTRHAKR